MLKNKSDRDFQYKWCLMLIKNSNAELIKEENLWVTSQSSRYQLFIYRKSALSSSLEKEKSLATKKQSSRRYAFYPKIIQKLFARLKFY